MAWCSAPARCRCSTSCWGGAETLPGACVSACPPACPPACCTTLVFRPSRRPCSCCPPGFLLHACLSGCLLPSCARQLRCQIPSAPGHLSTVLLCVITAPSLTSLSCALPCNPLPPSLLPPSPCPHPPADARRGDAEGILKSKWAGQDPQPAAASGELYFDILRYCHQVRCWLTVSVVWFNEVILKCMQ